MSVFWIFRARSVPGQAGAFAVGIVLVMLTLALRFYIHPGVENPSLVFFVPAILLTSCVGGLWAGFCTTLISCACSAYFLLPPLHSLRVTSSFELMDLTALALTGLFVAAICQLLRETIQRAEAANAELVQAHKATDQLAAIVEHSSDSIIGKTLDGFITSWNKSSAVTFGYSSAEMIGSHISMLIPPSLLAEEQATLAEIASGHSVNHFETSRLHKDGSIIHVSITVSPVRDAHGVIIGASTTMRDITENKRAEKENQSTRVKLEAALFSMTDAVFICDPQGNLVHFNRAFATLHRFQNVAECARTLEQYPALFEAFEAGGQLVPFEQWPVSRALRGETGVAEITLRRKDSGERWIVIFNFAPIVPADGTMTGVVVTVRDVTRQKQSEARLETLRGALARAGRLNDLGQISAGLAHELNQPLAAMVNYSNAAKRLIANREPVALEKAYGAISKATDQANRAAEIILRMRAFIENRGASRAIENINAIVEDAMAVGLMCAQANSITTHLNLSADMPPVFADRVQIQQVLVNLLRNAVEAMENAPRRELTISTAACEDGSVDVAVIDTGPGIPPELADNLFMPFVTSKPGGMGIGLVISQSIIEAHGGRIQVASNPGGGTRFCFRLPAASAARAAA